MKSFKISVIKFLPLLLTMLMLGTAITFAQVTPVNITVPTVSGPLNGTAVIPIKVDDVTNKGVYSFDVTMEYNKSVIEVTGVSAGDAFATGGQLQHTIDVSGANGKLTVAWARGTVVAGSGTLLNVNITFKTAGSFTPTWTFGFNAGSPAVGTTTIGMVKAASIQVFVDNVSTSGLSNEFLIPIKTTALASTDEVYSFDLNATYDATKLQITGVELIGGGDVPLGAGGYAQINATGGNITLNWARGTKLTTGVAGTLLYLKAKALAKAVSVIDITGFQFNNGTPVAVGTSGTITIVNKKPTFAATTQALETDENKALSFTAVATDGDADALTYSLTGTPPTGAVITPVGVFTWTPTYVQAGTYAVVISVTDGVESATLTLNITIKDVNRKPTITLTPPGPFTVAEGSALTIKAVGADVDTDNTLTLSATGLPSGASFASATGDFAWTPNFSQAGSYTVVFKVKDSKNEEATVNGVITVTNNNQAPRFDVTGAKQMPDTSIWTGKNFVFTYKAIDPQGDIVSYYLNQPAPSNAILIPSTGVFGWRPANEQAGKHYIVVSASDGVLTTNSRIATVTVQYDTKVEENGVPTAFELFQNYPNPFNPTTNIKYALPKESRVRIAVFNILGQEVATLVNSVMPAGYHSVDFKANSIPSGMYIYKIETESFSQVKKMLLMK